MPSLNQAAFIGVSIDSVLGQDYPNIELIVADGGSEDGTVDLLKTRQAADSRLRWFSRRDNGPAQAINAALAEVRGTVVGWLNSDDVYTPGAVRRAAEALIADPGLLMVYGHGQHIDACGNPLNLYPTLPPSTPLEKFAEGCFICQPTVFFRRSMFVLLGKLDEGLNAAFDFDYWLRAFLAFPGRIGLVDALQASSRLHEDCITKRMRRRVALEGMQVLARHLGSAPKEWLLTYVDELLAMPSGSQAVGDLKSHLDETLAVAKPWLMQDDLRALEWRLEELLSGWHHRLEIEDIDREIVKHQLGDKQ
jgi:glycosyltransferase involved in cell wall biosynthesis